MNPLSRGVVTALAATLLLGTGGAAGASPATSGTDGSGADGGASVAYAEATEDGLQLFVSVPRTAGVDLDATEVTVDGDRTTADAVPAGEQARVTRRAVLAIDVSRSMRGPRFDAARRAAQVYLDTVPENVAVGIVTFAGEVEVALRPTEDRGKARRVLAGLELSLGTRLYQGVATAVDQLGEEGQRSLLVLSDGADTTGAGTGEVSAAIAAAGVRVDVVSLQGRRSPPLAELATAGEGRVVDSSPAALTRAFSRRAQDLAEQVLVTADVPAQAPAEGTVTVRLPTPDGALTAEAFLALGEPAGSRASGPALPGSDDGGWFTVPPWLAYVAIVLVGIGLLLFARLLLPRLRPPPLSAADRIERYARLGRRPSAETPSADQDENSSITDRSLQQARQAATQVLRRNRGLEARISARLEAAGTPWKSAEWLLLHAGIAVGAGTVGALLGSGSVALGLVGLIAGAVLPWLWLGFMQRRRRAKFHRLLPDTLSLVSGSLSAGLSLTQSLDTILREGEEPVAGEFRRVLVEHRLGVTVEDALDGVAERFSSRDFAWVVMAIRIQRQVGGNLAELLDTVAATMREREYLRRQVSALSAEGRLSAWVLGGLPPLFLIYLVLTQRDYVMPLFTEPLGLVMLGGAATLLAVGVFWMSKLVKVEV